MRQNNSFVMGLVRASLNGGMPLAIAITSIVLGFLALQFTPKEEEPQIVVPMIDVLVEAPGLSASQVSRQVAIPLEKLLNQIPGVEHVYSASNAGGTVVTLRFYVGENREEALLNTYNKLYSHQHKVPAVVSNWRVQPVEVDDVPIMVLALYETHSHVSDASDFELRRVAEELSILIQAIENTSEVNVVGGRSRQVTIMLDPQSMAARSTTPKDVLHALSVSNVLKHNGRILLDKQSIRLESGDFFRSLDDLRNTVINVVDGVAISLKEVAKVSDSLSDLQSYSWINFSEPAKPADVDEVARNSHFPMVSLSVAKKPGSNAVTVANDVIKQIESARQSFIPKTMSVEIIRDYGQTAEEKVNNLSSSLLFAVLTVVIFIGVFLGWRAALVVGIAVPISYGVTLALDMAFGYTINRVTLFALILSLGLLVDDPITGVDNIERYLRDKARKGISIKERIVLAIAEIKVPLLMSTLTIILAFIPLAFITGMMGPYMAPMAFNVPVSVVVSTLVAFLVTPWLGSKFLKKPDSGAVGEDVNVAPQGFYGRLLSPLLDSPKRARLVLFTIVILFLLSLALPILRLVPLKLLPFDNKNEVQIVIDLPDAATLEDTSHVASQISDELLRFNEVKSISAFVGVASPIDFNGMVRRYNLRNQPHLADLRVTLVDKTEREHQSHAVVLRMREALRDYQDDGIKIRVVEVPPGPPVLSTLVAEVYGAPDTPYKNIQDAASQLADRLGQEAHVVELDTSIDDEVVLTRFIVDKNKAALSGVSTSDITQLLDVATGNQVTGVFQSERDISPVPIVLDLVLDDKTSENDLLRLQLKGQIAGLVNQTDAGLANAPYSLVPLGELGYFEMYSVDQTVYRKNLSPVVYVYAELNGRTPAEVIADVSLDQFNGTPSQPVQPLAVSDWQSRHFGSLITGTSPGMPWSVPDDIKVEWAGEGEWLITVRVFRDMGLAFLFALCGIFLVLRAQTASSRLALIIMSAIPLTMIGIMPGFWVMNQFGERVVAGAPDPVLFTATAMIGMIALAGIVVRNSLILVEYISQLTKQGYELRLALVTAGATRLRPVLLTAGTTMLGNLVIILDPVFSGLALAIMFGIVASTLFTLLVVPVVYYLTFKNQEAGSSP